MLLGVSILCQFLSVCLVRLHGSVLAGIGLSCLGSHPAPTLQPGPSVLMVV